MSATEDAWAEAHQGAADSGELDLDGPRDEVVEAAPPAKRSKLKLVLIGAGALVLLVGIAVIWELQSAQSRAVPMQSVAQTPVEVQSQDTHPPAGDASASVDQQSAPQAPAVAHSAQPEGSSPTGDHQPGENAALAEVWSNLDERVTRADARNDGRHAELVARIEALERQLQQARTVNHSRAASRPPVRQAGKPGSQTAQDATTAVAVPGQPAATATPTATAAGQTGVAPVAAARTAGGRGLEGVVLKAVYPPTGEHQMAWVMDGESVRVVRVGEMLRNAKVLAIEQDRLRTTAGDVASGN